MEKLMVMGTHIYVPGLGWAAFQGGLGGIRLDDHYSVQKINETEYWLQDLNDSNFRLKITVPDDRR